MVNRFKKVLGESLTWESEVEMVHNDLYSPKLKGGLLHVGRTSAEKNAIHSFLDGHIHIYICVCIYIYLYIYIYIYICICMCIYSHTLVV